VRNLKGGASAPCPSWSPRIAVSREATMVRVMDDLRLAEILYCAFAQIVIALK